MEICIKEEHGKASLIAKITTGDSIPIKTIIKDEKVDEKKIDFGAPKNQRGMEIEKSFSNLDTTFNF